MAYDNHKTMTSEYIDKHKYSKQQTDSEIQTPCDLAWDLQYNKLNKERKIFLKPRLKGYYEYEIIVFVLSNFNCEK